MYINVVARDGGSALELCEQEDFTAFKVVAARGADLARLGPRTDAGVLVPPALVVELAGRGEDAEWMTRFQQMLDAAARHGWVHADGSVQAHVEIRTA